MIVRCPYCKAKAKFVGGKRLYPHRPDLFAKRFFLCEPCDAFVGCHPHGAPMGTLANPELRAHRKAAHFHFDKLWKLGYMKRGHAYAWLKYMMGRETHIGESDAATCQLVVTFAKDKLRQLQARAAETPNQEPPQEGSVFLLVDGGGQQCVDDTRSDHGLSARGNAAGNTAEDHENV